MKLPLVPEMVLGYFIFISYNKVCMYVCLSVPRDVLTAEPIWFSYTQKLPIGPI